MTIARRVQGFPPSLFAEINILARQHGAVNLGQGAPDFDGAPEVLAAAVAALESGRTSQYAPSTGTPALREAIAEHAHRFYGQTVDPERGVLVTAGASLGIYFAILGLVDPGDEVVVFEPIFDTYIPNLELAGAVPRYVSLRPPRWHFDPDELAAAFNNRTRAILINTPHNPTGKIFTREELAFIADLCQRWDVIAIMDEVYEHLVFDGAEHVRMATLPDMADRTLTLSSAGKTFGVTGFKIGWCLGPEALIEGVRRVHEFTLFAVTHPEQEAIAAGLRLPDAYYSGLREFYRPKRDFLAETLRSAGLALATPEHLGAYYLVADFGQVFDGDDMAFTRHLIEQ
ncbi:MAG: aminotransferase class I/II-fold pyridoxal phosphate-dependent enzyme, partial [Anaerolineae bacterium]|nr:aminotransferase class I/II-fold pyridoxal phosphate-dependent enzyme [Anaerolineae bacterium]